MKRLQMKRPLIQISGLMLSLFISISLSSCTNRSFPNERYAVAYLDTIYFTKNEVKPTFVFIADGDTCSMSVRIQPAPKGFPCPVRYDASKPNRRVKIAENVEVKYRDYTVKYSDTKHGWKYRIY